MSEYETVTVRRVDEFMRLWDRRDTAERYREYCEAQVKGLTFWLDDVRGLVNWKSLSAGVKRYYLNRMNEIANRFQLSRRFPYKEDSIERANALCDMYNRHVVLLEQMRERDRDRMQTISIRIK